MRIGSAVFWVVVAAVLGVVAVVTAPAGRGVEAVEEVDLGLTQGQVTGVRVTEAGVGTSVMREGEGWVVEWTDADGRPARWSANADLVRAGVRLIATARFAARADAGDVAGGGKTIEVFGAEGETRMVSVGAGGIGGRVPAAISGAGDASASVWLAGNLDRALARESLLQWRDKRALAVADVTRFEVRAGQSGVALTSTNGVWKLEDDPLLNVNQRIAEGVVRDLREVAITRFLRGAAPAEAGLDMPGARVTVGGKSGERTLAIGSPADADRREFFALVSGSEGLGPVAVRIASGKLGAVKAAAIAYLGDTPIAGSRFDVAGVTITDADGGVVLDATRSYDGWRGGDGVLGESAQVNALVEAIGTTNADTVGTPQMAERIGSVRVRGLQGELTMAVTLERDGRAALVPEASFGEVAYVYDTDTHPWCAWLINRVRGAE